MVYKTLARQRDTGDIVSNPGVKPQMVSIEERNDEGELFFDNSSSIENDF